MTNNKSWQRETMPQFPNPPTKSDRKDYFGRKVFEVNRKVFGQYMWETPFLDRMVYYVIQGQLRSIRERKYRIAKRTYDNRVHGVAFLPSGSGKAGFTEYAGQLSSGCKMGFEVKGKCTDTSLVGGRRREEQYSQERQCKEMVIVEDYGSLNPLHDPPINIMHWNEADDLFDAPKSQWARNMMTIFQKTMNTYGTFDNIISGDTSCGRVEFNTSTSLLIVSKPPLHFYKAITDLGFLQRTLMSYIDYDWERKKSADLKTLELFCDDTSDVDEDADIRDVVKVLLAINKFYRGKGRLEVEKDAKKLILGGIYDTLHEPLETMTPIAQRTLSQFVSRWQEQILNLSYHNCYTRLGSKITVQDVADAKNLVYPLWKGVIYAIEEGIEEDRDSKSKWKIQRGLMLDWVKKLGKKYKSKEGWVPRNVLVKVLASRDKGWGCNPETARSRVARAESEGYLIRKDVKGSPIVKPSAKPINI